MDKLNNNERVMTDETFYYLESELNGHILLLLRNRSKYDNEETITNMLNEVKEIIIKRYLNNTIKRNNVIKQFDTIYGVKLEKYHKERMIEEFRHEEKFILEYIDKQLLTLEQLKTIENKGLCEISLSNCSSSLRELYTKFRNAYKFGYVTIAMGAASFNDYMEYVYDSKYSNDNLLKKENLEYDLFIQEYTRIYGLNISDSDKDKLNYSSLYNLYNSLEQYRFNYLNKELNRVVNMYSNYPNFSKLSITFNKVIELITIEYKSNKYSNIEEAIRRMNRLMSRVLFDFYNPNGLKVTLDAMECDYLQNTHSTSKDFKEIRDIREKITNSYNNFEIESITDAMNLFSFELNRHEYTKKKSK